MKRCHDRVVRRLTTNVVAAQNRHKRVILRNSTKLYIAAESRTLSCSEKERMVGIAKELEMFRAPEQMKARHTLYFRHQGTRAVTYWKRIRIQHRFQTVATIGIEKTHFCSRRTILCLVEDQKVMLKVAMEFDKDLLKREDRRREELSLKDGFWKEDEEGEHAAHS